MIMGVHISWNAYAINVQWYTQRIVGVIEYVVETNPPIVQGNSEMALAGLNDHRHQVHGSKSCMPRPQTLCLNQIDMFGLLPARVSLQTIEGNWYRREFGNMWLMDETIRDDAVERADLC
jgi:hypothetical protein